MSDWSVPKDAWPGEFLSETTTHPRNRGGRRRSGPRSLLRVAIVCGLIAGNSGCASIQGYPIDPENTDSTLLSLKPYFDGTEEKNYIALAGNEAVRQQKRDEIVLARLRGYDIEFSAFEKGLYGQGNTISTGGDLIALILAGLTATTGGTATKAALGAASAGVIGAQAAINKDLYYQRTIPALIAQMEASRAKAKLTIIQGLGRSDAKYSLMQAYLDLDVYKDAGSIPGAVSSVTQDAGNAKEAAQSAITFARTAASVAQLPDIQSVQTEMGKLTAPQLLALAKIMQQFLAARPQGIQQLVKGLDPNGAWLNGNANAAKLVLTAWLHEEDMTAANKKQWTDAIAQASQ
jgi:hypothetical protein